MSSFFTPISQKTASNTKIEWQVRDGTLLMGKYRAKDYSCPPAKIAAFDLVQHLSCFGRISDEIRTAR
jgi:hypothetical protein